MKRIDLLPPEARVKASRERGLLYAILIIVAVVVALGLVYMQQNSTVSSKHTEVDGLNAETQVEQQTAAALAPYAEIQSTRVAMTATASSIYQAGVPWSTILQEISLVIPENVRLQTLDCVVPPAMVPGGVVAAAGNNRVGVAGVAFGCAVLPVKVMDASGFASYSCLAQGIKYAVDQGARVINISIAGSSSSATLQGAIDYAWSNNVVIVAAAGNNANNTPQYPAACDHVVGVSATEPDDSLASFSSYGSFVSLSAPGDNIWTTQDSLNDPYGAWRGTSFASPIVAGVAALVVSENPSLSNTQIVSIWGLRVATRRSVSAV